MLEIDCKHTKFNKPWKRGSGTVNSSGNHKRDLHGHHVNITNGSLKRQLSPVCFENSGLTKEMWNFEISSVHNALDFTMPTQESSPGKIKTRAKPELSGRRSLRTSQSKSQIKGYSKEISQARDSGTGNREDIEGPICRDQNPTISIKNQRITRKPSEKRVRNLADHLKPIDLKSLTKRQIRDLKDGRESPERLIWKYGEEQFFTVNPDDNRKLNEEGLSSKNTLAKNDIFLSPENFVGSHK